MAKVISRLRESKRISDFRNEHLAVPKSIDWFSETKTEMHSCGNKGDFCLSSFNILMETETEFRE